MFSAGARFVVAGHSYRTFDWAPARGMVDHLLSTYDRNEATAEAAE
jgi:4-hydroxyphenylacetate 3-monooxygenase